MQGAMRLWPGRALAALLALIGTVITIGGVFLLGLGGSAYYVLGGLAVIGAAILLWMGRPAGALVYAAFLAVTFGWAWWEVGADGWGLAPRLIGPAVLGLAFALPAIRRRLGRAVWVAAGAGASLLLAQIAVATTSGFEPNDALAVPIQPVAQAGVPGEWLQFGRDAAGTRFSPLTQIGPANVDQLEQAWTYRTGVVQTGAKSALEATPLMVGDTLYLCTQTNIVVALDPETGMERWRFDPKVDATGASAVRTCRGVAFHSAASAVDCPERIVTATFDARLIALDAHTGRPCPSFGQGGFVDLKQGMGQVEHGFYYVSSAPVIVRGNIVLGGWVADNQSNDEPSGVIRAFDAVTGRFAWAWDAGNPGNARGPAPGETYTRSTPNSWAPMSGDEALGLVYVPTGNPTPDHFGGHRSPASEKYGSSVVALDATSGAPRWSFQTTHHDLWDYDVPAQPTLFDATLNGVQVPALVQATKRGELFLLDRRDGRPISPVVERTVPQRGAVAGERLAPTQPFSIDMPSFAGPPLNERSMWGLTPIDQLWCRIRFRQLRYEGHATPPGLDESLIYPSIGGGMNYGGVAIDPARQLMIVNTLYYGTIAQLVPRAETDRLREGASHSATNFDLPQPQAGTPFGVRLLGLVSPINVPCNAPPYGMLSAIDLRTRKLLWSRPFGTARDMGPMGVSLQLPIPMGGPNFGGAMTTASGLTFIGAVREKTFRAFDTASGRELWSARIPASGHGNPMTYVSKKSGRQFVVIAAGGHAMLQSPLNDTFVAFALPKKN